MKHLYIVLFLFLMPFMLLYRPLQAQITEEWAYLYNGPDNGSGAFGLAITTDKNGYIYTCYGKI